MFLTLNSHITYHRFDIRIITTTNTMFEAWIGAVLRNNLLYAAEQVRVKDADKNLREFIGTCPLASDHPLYARLKDGFPAPYVIACESDAIFNMGKIYHKGEIVSFSVYLIGKFASYFKEMTEAFQILCEKGFGHPIRPVILLSVIETSNNGRVNILFEGGQTVSNQLMYPIRLQSEPSLEIRKKQRQMEIFLQTPMTLYKVKSKESNEKSYQCKMNGFPSFYQLIRSSIYRLLQLGILYEDLAQTDYDAAIAIMDDYLLNAQKAQLISAEISHIKIQSHHQKGRKDMITFAGYIGKLVFKGDLEQYLPLLEAIECIGVGDAVVYGMGRIKVNVV